MCGISSVAEVEVSDVVLREAAEVVGEGETSGVCFDCGYWASDLVMLSCGVCRERYHVVMCE